MTEDAAGRPGTVHRQKARRSHDCAECPDPIRTGQEYIFLNTFDRGKWSRYVLCLECERIRSCHRFVGVAIDSEMPLSAGNLRSEVKDLCRVSPEYKRIFLEAWAASAPVKEADA